MLKRKDLVKEFELVVTQEIKNYQDERYALNQAINSLNRSIEELCVKMDARFAKLESFASKSEARSLEIDIRLLELESKLDSNFNDLRKADTEIEGYLGSSLNLVSDLIAANAEIFKKIDANLGATVQNKQGIELLRKHVDRQFTVTSSRCTKEVADSLEYILSRPSEALQVKRELEGMIGIEKKDLEGFKKELMINKKSLYIFEKNIENIYTLIDRLKESS